MAPQVTSVLLAVTMLMSAPLPAPVAEGAAGRDRGVSIEAVPISQMADRLSGWAEEEPVHIDLSIVGDCLMASQKGSGAFARKAAEGDWTYFLGGVSSVFAQDDWTICNLECVLTDRPLQETDKGYTPAYWYKGPTANTNILTSSSVEVCNLSNNHTRDYGAAGAQDTKDACDAAGLLWGDSGKTLYLEKDGVTIALICNGLWSEGQANTIVTRLQEASQRSNYQIVYYHGGTERVNTPEEWRMRASRKLIDAGADLVIGDHPHVIQPMEYYHGKYIFYSMGNFCFGDERHPQNRTLILSLGLDFYSDGTYAESIGLIPCYVYTGESNNYRPEFITDEAEKARVIQFMNWEVSTPVG